MVLLWLMWTINESVLLNSSHISLHQLTYSWLLLISLLIVVIISSPIYLHIKGSSGYHSVITSLRQLKSLLIMLTCGLYFFLLILILTILIISILTLYKFNIGQLNSSSTYHTSSHVVLLLGKIISWNIYSAWKK